MTPTGSESTRLAIVRGNSGSGKSSVALAVRSHLGRTCAVAAQDVIRRTILKERDVPGGVNIGLLSTVARYALDNGFHVIVEGILHAERYGDMLAELAADHRGRTGVYYLDVSFEESLRRHEARPQSGEFGAEHMREWYRERDLLGLAGEQLIPSASSLQNTVARILAEVFEQRYEREPDPIDPVVLGSAVRE
ncbi:kinase [Prauserella flavalba]|uniref:Kinase n=1 Tax=Prauserella flavalba TaxID=1477506 RepID=A0A318LX68_9PSEU|nr:kinase [Prauserella flavalba]PXY16720.1 kinase [Prauserella flavalba]